MFLSSNCSRRNADLTSLSMVRKSLGKSSRGLATIDDQGNARFWRAWEDMTSIPCLKFDFKHHQEQITGPQSRVNDRTDHGVAINWSRTSNTWYTGHNGQKIELFKLFSFVGLPSKVKIYGSRAVRPKTHSINQKSLWSEKIQTMQSCVLNNRNQSELHELEDCCVFFRKLAFAVFLSGLIECVVTWLSNCHWRSDILYFCDNRT